MKPKRRIYLASPYTHDSWDIRQLRYQTIVRLTGALFNKFPDLHIHAPIVATHALAEEGGVKWSGKKWLEYDYPYFRACQELWVMKMEGWKESAGVTQEIKWSKHPRLGIPVLYINPDTLEFENESQGRQQNLGDTVRSPRA